MGTIFLMLIIVSCSISKTNIENSKNEILYKDGKIIYDYNGNGTYIPNDLLNKNIIKLRTFVIGDSLKIKSEYSYSDLPMSFNFVGNLISKDSIYIKINTKHFAKGFIILKTFNDFNDEKEASLIGTSNMISIKEINAIQLKLLNATSEKIFLGKNNLRDTLEISLDYIDPMSIKKYTFINETIYRGR